LRQGTPSEASDAFRSCRVNKKKTDSRNDIRPEYDFAKLKGGVRGKYIKRFREGTNIVSLELKLQRLSPMKRP
jgi:hypothetical protein